MFSRLSLFILSDIQHFAIVAQSLFLIIANIFVIALVIVAIVFITRVLTNSSYSIRQINVPAAFEHAGYSGPVIANRIHIRLNEIIQRVSATQYAKAYTTSATESDVSVDVGGMGLPLKGFIELIGGAFGIKRNKRIDADIFIEGSSLVMLVRIIFHLSKEHLLTKNLPLFFETLEKSFDRGLKSRLVLKDQELAHVLEDPQMKKLLLKYAD